ncbi:MAG TPA: tetratricopeptide repeat protein [Vicinamibacterales bacterium]|nr:tetratricopeptide repeat protein [Vicinamibacterales bacterium]
MSRESLFFAISGTFFGLMVGWMIGSQRGPLAPAAAPPQQVASQTAGQSQEPARALDEQRANQLAVQASTEPQNAAIRAELGNLYFDADRFDDAIKWYEDSLRLRPADPDVSTDLGIAFYYTNQPDRALAQFAHSLGVNPSHTKTMLNQGIVLAFAKQDLDAAAKSWERVVQLAPDSPEGQAAKRALDGLRSAHPAAGTPPGGPG